MKETGRGKVLPFWETKMSFLFVFYTSIAACMHTDPNILNSLPNLELNVVN